MSDRFPHEVREEEGEEEERENVGEDCWWYHATGVFSPRNEIMRIDRKDETKTFIKTLILIFMCYNSDLFSYRLNF